MVLLLSASASLLSASKSLRVFSSVCSATRKSLWARRGDPAHLFPDCGLHRLQVSPHLGELGICRAKLRGELLQLRLLARLLQTKVLNQSERIADSGGRTTARRSRFRANPEISSALPLLTTSLIAPFRMRFDCACASACVAI